MLASLVVAARVQAQAPGAEAQIKAAFVYNFLKFVEWPADSFERPDDPLVVAIVGDGPLADAPDRLLTMQQVGERPVVVRHVKWDKPLAGVHAIVVTETDVKKLRRVLEAASLGHILSIGEGAAFASTGGVIGLVIEGRKVRFDIDLDVANTTGLKVSSKLLALTRVVHSDKINGDRP
jgi:uncharacterized protein DUF4154